MCLCCICVQWEETRFWSSVETYSPVYLQLAKCFLNKFLKCFVDVGVVQSGSLHRLQVVVGGEIQHFVEIHLTVLTENMQSMIGDSICIWYIYAPL